MERTSDNGETESGHALHPRRVPAEKTASPGGTIVQSTTYVYESSQEMGALFDLEKDGFFYTRLGNPTLDVVEKKIAALEGGVAPCSPLPARPPTSWRC